MNLRIIGRHMNIYGEVRDYAEAKIPPLERFYDQIQSMDLTLSMEGDDKIAELRIKARVGGPFVATERAGEFFAAIDLLVDKMARQLKKQKDRLKKNYHSDRMPAAPEVHDPDDDLESYQEVVDKMDISPL